jgi:hypothetical protein
MDPNLILKTPTPKQPAAVAPASQRNTWTDGFFKLKQCDLDLEKLRINCFQVSEFIKKRYSEEKFENGFGARTTNLFEKYNLFMIASGPMHELFKEIVTFWNTWNPSDDIFYMQAWMNIYEEAPNLGWHHHSPGYMNSYHGYFCVDVDNSQTTYAMEPKYYQDCIAHDYTTSTGDPLLTYNEKYEIVDVMNRDNLLVIAGSVNDMHRSMPWKIQTRPRITIAFDIVPGRWIENSVWENHWIPLI